MAGQCRCGCGALLLARLQLIVAGAAEARVVLALRWCGTLLRVFVDGLRGCLVRGGSECRIGVVWICALFSVGCLGIVTVFWARLFGDFMIGFGRSARIFGVGRHMLVVGSCFLVARCTFRWVGAHFQGWSARVRRVGRRVAVGRCTFWRGGRTISVGRRTFCWVWSGRW